MRRRREWFERIGSAPRAVVGAGRPPADRGEAEERLTLLRRAHGPSPQAFTFRHSFTAPDEPSTDLVEDARDLCPA